MKKNTIAMLFVAVSLWSYGQGTSTKPKAAPSQKAQVEKKSDYKLGDTLYVNEKGVYVIFPKAIDVVSFGTDGLYKGTFKDKSLRISPVPGQVYEPVPVLVQFGGEEGNVLTKFVVYRKNVPAAFIDLTKDPDVNVSAEERKRREEEEKLRKEKERVKKKLDDMLALGDEVRTVGVKSGNLFFAFTNIRIDDSYSYLKFYLQNNTNIPFKIDYIRIQNVEKTKSKGDDSIDNKDSDIEPFVATEILDIPRNAKEYLLYAVPLAGASDKGGYQVTIKEKAGNRRLQVLIPSRFIDRAKTTY